MHWDCLAAFVILKEIKENSSEFEDFISQIHLILIQEVS